MYSLACCRNYSYP